MRQSLQLFTTLALTDFKLRYNGSVLGFVWALLKPLLIFLIMNFVFSNIFGVGDPYFSIKLLTGIILWNFFSEGTMTGMSSLLSKANILSKVHVPYFLVVLSSIANALLTFLINLLILAGFFAASGVLPSWEAVLLFAFYCLLVFLVILAFSLFSSTLYLKFRDLNQIWEVLLTAGFYACPIIYPIDVIPVNLQWILLINPMTFIVQYSKLALLEGKIINLQQHLIYISVLLLALLISILIFRRNAKYTAQNF